MARLVTLLSSAAVGFIVSACCTRPPDHYFDLGTYVFDEEDGAGEFTDSEVRSASIELHYSNVNLDYVTDRGRFTAVFSVVSIDPPP